MNILDTNNIGLIDSEINQCLKPSTSADDYERLLSNVIKQLIKMSLGNENSKINIQQLQSLR